MTPSTRRRVGWALLVLGTVALGVGYVGWGLKPFAGTLYVAKDSRERSVVSIAGSTIPPNISAIAGQPIYRDVEGAAVRFESPRAAEAAVDPTQRYDVVGLPFLVCVRTLESFASATESYGLSIVYPDREETQDLVTGGEVIVNGQPYAVRAIQPWTGLVRDGGGVPMVALRYRDNARDEFVTALLADGDWRALTQHTSLRFQWAQDEAAAQSFCREVPPPELSGRWGARDDVRITWIEHLRPGSGLDLLDGRSVTLQSFTPPANGAPASIQLSITRNGTTSVEKLEANAPERGDFRFEYWASGERLLSVAAYREGAVLFSARGPELDAAVRELREGETWRGPDGAELELAQAMPQARPVPPGYVDVTVLDAHGERIALRAGERIRVGDAFLSLVGPGRAPRERTGFVILDADGAERAAFSLEATFETAQSASYDGWTLVPELSDPTYPSVVAFGVYSARSRMPFVPGALLVLLGVALLTTSAVSATPPSGPQSEP